LKTKAQTLLSILEGNPFRNPPPYEKLIGDLDGAYSRRINIQHQLVYQVIDQEGTGKINGTDSLVGSLTTDGGAFRVEVHRARGITAPRLAGCDAARQLQLCLHAGTQVSDAGTYYLNQTPLRHGNRSLAGPLFAGYGG
jgi:Txe/YoeB family toxin of toxin-antitoxin system